VKRIAGHDAGITEWKCKSTVSENALTCIVDKPITTYLPIIISSLYRNIPNIPGSSNLRSRARRRCETRAKSRAFARDASLM